MKAERWKRIDDLLQAAMELAPELREDYLRDVCDGDPVLADEVRSLLTSHRRAGDFLETPAPDMAARAIAAEAVPASSASRAGQIVSHYRLLRMIGSGGMGTVWLAERCDGRFERKVAIKFIHFASFDANGSERFEREGAILGKLYHPQIAELVDAGLTSTGEPFLALEYVEGLPIDEHCDRNTLDIDSRIRLFLEVLSAVEYAHRNLIVHRDIKPTNVFIRNDGKVKLLDFGIAKVLADERSAGSAAWATLEGGAALTPRFASPEQLTQGTITTATDIYSLGVLLYLLLTGQHPSGSGLQSPAQLIKRIVEEEPSRASGAVEAADTDAAVSRATTPEKLCRQLHGDLDRVIAKALKNDPAERYPSVLTFADDLRRYLEHKPILARPDSLGYRTAKFARRNRLAVALAAVALIAVATGVTWIVIQNRRVRIERDIAFVQVARVYQHDEFLDFLISDAAPNGKPFTVNDLLDRATKIVAEQKTSPTQVELFEWIGNDYGAQDEHGKARSVLDHAYQLSRQSNDPSTRASASCVLGLELSRDEDLARGATLIQEGLSGLPTDPLYAMARVECLRFGSQVSREAGNIHEAVHQMETAQAILRTSPFDSDIFEMVNSLDLAAVYSEAGKDREALEAFQRAGALISSLGRGETETAVVLYNDWALELDQAGRPLQAEQMYRRVIDISRDSSTEEAVSPMVLTNYARVLRELDHLPQAADYAERAYSKAKRTRDELVISQSLLERARIHRAQHKLANAEAMLTEVEPRLSRTLPPGHYAFAGTYAERALIAMEKHDLTAALMLADKAIAAVQTTVKAGGEGSFLLPSLYIDRSEIDIALGRSNQAEVDSNIALALLHSVQPVDDISSKIGTADLALARAFASQGNSARASDVAKLAFALLERSIGPDHPETRSAKHLADTL